MAKREPGPWYTNLKEGDTIVIRGEIPIRVVFIEKRTVGIAVDPPEAYEVKFDPATRTLERSCDRIRP